MKRKVILLFLIIEVVCFGQDKLKGYEKDNYSVGCPENWRLDTSGQMNTKFILFSPLKDDDIFSENINLITQDLTNQGFTMESYMKLSENQIKTLVTDGKVLESFFDAKNNHHVMVWSGNVTGEILKFKQYFFMQNEIVYVLTLTTKPDTYDEYKIIGVKILDSFKLK